MDSQPTGSALKKKFKLTLKKKGRAGLTQFRRIELSLLEEDVLLFDLYLFDREKEELIPFMSAGSTFSLSVKEELSRRGIKALFVPVKDKKTLDIYLESHLPEVLKSDIPPRRKLELTYYTAQHVMDDLFTDYYDKHNIQRAKNLISSIIELFLSGEGTLFKNMIDLTIHDYYTYTHCLHVCLYGTAMALNIYSDKDLDRMKHISFGFLMHDIGKTKVNPAILKKPAGLTKYEWQEIKNHPWWGYRILEDLNELTPDVGKIVLHHHERVDGSGYPSGLIGYEMGMLSRICAFADVFDAMTSERPYQKAMPAFEALKFIRDEMNSLKDQRLFELFTRLFTED